MEELPNSFDIIVVGTGMPECIISAAAARIGKKVLHVDRNGYYGGDWASFSFDKFMEWMNEVKQPSEQTTETPLDLISSFASFLKEGEDLVICPTRPRTITNLSYKSYIKQVAEPMAIPNEVVTSSEVAVVEASPENTTESSESGQPLPSISLETQEDPAEGSNSSETEIHDHPSNQSIQLPEHEWTFSSFMDNRRKFNIDLAPKIMFSRGSLVELLISSNIARYAEFQCITRVLTYINGHIEQVPSARADVFSTKNVSIVEKRMLMKFLTFCLNFEEHSEEFKGYEERPFVEFLQSKKLSANVEHYIVHAIAMVDEDCVTVQGLKATQKFLQSLGRYGKSPFLCTCYGSAELPQCFCRLCAVYEGLYYLKRKVEGVILKDNKCLSLVTMGQRIDCEWLVMESSYASPELYARHLTKAPERISRAILIVDNSICPSEKKENTFLRLPPSTDIKNTVTVIELTAKNYVCPEDLYLVYMYCRSTEASAEEDLKPAVNLLYPFEEDPSKDNKLKNKSSVLWSVYFNQRDTSTVPLNSDVPEGFFLTSSPDIELDYEHAVHEAKSIFERMYPGEEFLPRAPDPEDIIIESQNNPGEEGEGGKIENDVTSPEDDVSKEDDKECCNTEDNNEISAQDVTSDAAVTETFSEQ